MVVEPRGYRFFAACMMTLKAVTLVGGFKLVLLASQEVRAGETRNSINFPHLSGTLSHHHFILAQHLELENTWRQPVCKKGGMTKRVLMVLFNNNNKVG
jgi:hypothetical protein